MPVRAKKLTALTWAANKSVGPLIKEPLSEQGSLLSKDPCLPLLAGLRVGQVVGEWQRDGCFRRSCSRPAARCLGGL